MSKPSPLLNVASRSSSTPKNTGMSSNNFSPSSKTSALVVPRGAGIGAVRAEQANTIPSPPKGGSSQATSSKQLTGELGETPMGEIPVLKQTNCNSPVRTRAPASQLPPPLAPSSRSATSFFNRGTQQRELYPMNQSSNVMDFATHISSSSSSSVFTRKPSLVNSSLDSAQMGGFFQRATSFLIPPVVFPDGEDVPQFFVRKPAINGHNAQPASPTFSDEVVTSPTSQAHPSFAPPPTIKSYVSIVFDLDETLCSNRRPGRAILRPGTMDMLKGLKALQTNSFLVEIILWTASMECVARPVLDRMDPHGALFSHAIFRDRRWYKETGYTKDLRLLGREMTRTVIVENSPLSVQLNKKHAIMVKDFLGGPGSTGDTQLKSTYEILQGWIQACQEQQTSMQNELARECNRNNSTGGVNDLSCYPPLAEVVSIVQFLHDHPLINMRNEVLGMPMMRTSNGVNLQPQEKTNRGATTTPSASTKKAITLPGSFANYARRYF